MGSAAAGIVSVLVAPLVAAAAVLVSLVVVAVLASGTAGAASVFLASLLFLAARLGLRKISPSLGKGEVWVVFLGSPSATSESEVTSGVFLPFLVPSPLKNEDRRFSLLGSTVAVLDGEVESVTEGETVDAAGVSVDAAAVGATSLAPLSLSTLAAAFSSFLSCSRCQ